MCAESIQNSNVKISFFTWDVCHLPAQTPGSYHEEGKRMFSHLRMSLCKAQIQSYTDILKHPDEISVLKRTKNKPVS